jgi:DNA-binding NarL/FixJ family response regulator
MLGAAGGIRDGMGTTIRPVDHAHHEGMLRQARAALGAEPFAAAGRRGRTTPADAALAEAIDLATALIEQLAATAAPRPQASTAGAGQPDSGRFTEREEAVLNLLVLGLSDREIGERLFISGRTASSHVGRILAKLDVSTRTAATAVALREGLVREEAAPA